MSLFNPKKPKSGRKKSESKSKKSTADKVKKTTSQSDISGLVPIISVKNNVIYPHTVVPVFFEDKVSLAALEDAQAGNKLIGAFTLNKEARDRIAAKEEVIPMLDDQASAAVKEVEPSDLYKIGTVCVVHRVMPVAGRDGAMGVLQGVSKVEALEFFRDEKMMSAMVLQKEEKVRETKAVKALMKNALATAQKIIQNTPYLPQELQHALGDLSDPLKFVYMLATLIRFEVSERQVILEEDSVEQKLKKTAAILSRELEQIELGGKIVSNVRKEFGRMSKEAYLRQQLKEIQRELGEETETQKEAQEYRDKLDNVGFSNDVRKEVEREIRRFEDMHPQSSEYQVVRTYLDWIFDLPWEVEHSEKTVSLNKVEKEMDQDHYGLKEVKERVLEYLAVQELNKGHNGPILCFVGPPGVGKTSLGKSIANALGREFVRMSLGGMKDESEIRGHRRTYVGAMPGRVVQGIKRAGTMDPVFMLDEVDKIGNDFRGDPSSALLEVLDPEQNDSFQDHYLGVNYDLSKVLFIATANVLDTIQPALRDRMEIIELSGYTNEEKEKIAKKHLWPRVLKRHGLKKSQVKIKELVWQKLINEYTREAGVRGFEKVLAKMARKVAYQIVVGKQKSVTINESKLRELLGSQKVFPEVAARTSRPGVVTGLAYTQSGGTILFVEATKMPGGKKFELTGSLGNVMKESAKAALSLVRARSKKLGIEEDFFKTNDIHLHVPAGAVPKDGPSAGVTMVTALASLLMNKRVRKDVAMTGEITLSGQVLPIGGVKEKVLAAKRAGIKLVLLPERNKSDLEEIDSSLLKGLKFEFVSDIDQVLRLALLKK